MRVAHKVAVAIVVIIIALLALLLPRSGHADQTVAFGDIVIRYSAISTDQLFAAVAKRYGIERSPHNGMVNITVERKLADGEAEMIPVVVTGKVAELTRRATPIRFHESRDEGGIEYLGQFPLSESGTYVFTIEVFLVGGKVPYPVKFNRDYVLD